MKLKISHDNISAIGPKELINERQKLKVFIHSVTSTMLLRWGLFYHPAMCEVGGQLVLRLPYIFRVCWFVCVCVCTHHVHNNYITYIVAMWLCFSRLQIWADVAQSSTATSSRYWEAEAT